MIGLCLKYEATNYGSKLQALATIRIFDRLGLKYQVIHYQKAGLWFKLKALTRIFNSTFRQDKIEGFSKKKTLKKHPEIAPMLRVRQEMFNRFDAVYFNKYEVVGKYFSDIKKLALRYDAVVSCSDQLWSPSGLGTNFYNLMFVPDSVKKVSFASSFGVSEIPWYQKKATAKYLKRIEWVSCRENQGALIVKQLTGRNVPVLMDPVFAFDIEEWAELVPEESIYNESYIFCCFLGNNPAHRISATRFAKQHGLKIVCIKYLDQYVPIDENFGDISLFDTSPHQFLNILRGASYIITDSFHVCAFSIIMQKQFVVLNRYASNSSCSKNSRIESVCANLGLSDRRADGIKDISDVILRPIDWSAVDEKQSIYRNRIWDYLKMSLL